MTSGNAWLVCREPVHIGGADSDSRGNNNPIYRLPDRTPAIPGSSLRGALREHAENDDQFKDQVNIWFGGDTSAAKPGSISLGWGWPVWWPVHVLGYGNWWVSCLAWLRRYSDLIGVNPPQIENKLLITNQDLNRKTVYLRWVKLESVTYQAPEDLPLPQELQTYKDRLLVVPNDSINTFVDMGLVRQPRVSLKSPNELTPENETDEGDEEEGSLVKNLFAVEGIPPGAAFVVSWNSRQTDSQKPVRLDDWNTFLHQEHHLGGLWSVGYGRIVMNKIV